ncbi:hypothetical protein J2Z32_003740 [Paenibacillus turicensis]|uniref:Phage protein n=1 Tax=Paenibacillus turicensis TaxID=160487 RepID=A0ABS4FX28_9BACL|nr:hypothetical protein [Paenibacillus turicensis]MBP1907075.1 hypothetical protein [Paenibacillus turicensis]
MEITLKINGEDKTFTQSFIPARIFRKTIVIQKKLQGEIDETVLDALIDYIVTLFGKQFSVDELYDGLDARRLLDAAIKCVNEVVFGSSDAVGAEEVDPNA